MHKLTGSSWRSLLHWYKAEGRHNLPWRRNANPWVIFVAENLLRRTRSESVAEIFTSTIKEFPNPKSVIQHEIRWKEITAPLGISARADHFLVACKILTDKYEEQVPDQYSDLIALPGVGHYIANAVLCFAYNIPTYIIDTNTLRIASRITGKEVTQEVHRTKRAKAIISSCFSGKNGLSTDQNYALLDLANSICTPVNPNCLVCPISNICQYAAAPAKGPGKRK